jgi:hypothetical protein
MQKDVSEDMLVSIGEHYRQLLKDAMGKSPPLQANSPETIAKKGRNEPYIDTGELRDNLGYRTTKNRSVKK